MSSSTSTTTMYTISRGDFGALGLDDQSVFMLSRAFAMMEATPGSWDILAQPDIPGDGGFMFSSNPLLNEISRKIGDDPECGHSGASYGWTMRNMESIAKKGWDKYCLMFPKRKREPSPEQIKAFEAQLMKDEIKAQIETEKKVSELTARIAALEAENAQLRNRISSRPSVMEQAAAVDNFITKNAKNADALASPAAFADAISRDPAMRAMIPDIDEQASAMKKFSEGKLSYAEMRSLCG